MEITTPASNRKAKGLIFGPSGAGKTTLLGTANDDPRTAPMLLLDFEGGVASLVGRDIDIVSIRTWTDYNEAYEYLRQGDHKYQSVAIDSVSETHVFALLTALESEASARRNPDLLQQGDYGIALVQMRKLLRRFRDLPLHVFYTALAMADNDKRLGTIQKPSFAGKAADEVPGIVDVVGYLGLAEDDEGETHRVLLLRDHPGYAVKIRVPTGSEVPDMIVDPTIGMLLDVLGYTE